MKPFIEYSSPRRKMPQVFTVDIAAKLSDMNPRLLEPAMAQLQAACKRGRWKITTHTEYLIPGMSPHSHMQGWVSQIRATKV